VTTATRVRRTSLEAYQRFLFHYRKRDGQPLAVASQHSRLVRLKVWFKWLTHRKYIPRDPAVELELPRVGYKLPNVMNKEEVERVLSQPKIEVPLGIRDRAILASLTSTCRRHEIDPQLYFTQLLLNLPPLLRALPHTRSHELDAWLPDQWKRAQATRSAQGMPAPPPAR
ncbi:MAG: hypothetical protein WCA41_02425, partial [Candidatus Acidiferrum sp.]